MQGGNELKEAYKNMKREAKAAMAKAKNEAQQRARSRRDIGEVNVIKDQTGDMLTDEIKIKEMWREYFSNLLNVENAREQLAEVPAVEDQSMKYQGKR